jgi:tungstate transport system ATP-binding protein
MTDADTLLRLRNVKKRYGSFVLNIQELDVFSGEVLGLIGPTGAGKSTLLGLIAGLTRADKGHLAFSEQRYGSQELSLESRRRLTLVHQRPLLLTGSVHFNVGYGLRLRGQRNRTEIVDAILDRLGLGPLAQQSALTLSGGQCQLVALARSLVIEPEVLLLDEPTSHLDPAYVCRVEETIHELRQVRRMTVIWATHNLFQTRRVANRTALLLNGQMVEVSTTEELFVSPSDSRTADFVQGRMVY